MKVTFNDHSDYTTVAGPNIIEKIPSGIAEKPNHCQPTSAPTSAPTAMYGCERSYTRIAIGKFVFGVIMIRVLVLNTIF